MDIYSEFESIVKDRENKALIYKKCDIVQSLSYPKLFESVDTFARSLKKLGIKKGDSVGIMLPNCPEWIITDLAGFKIGAKIIAIPNNVIEDTLKYIIKDSKVKLLITNRKGLNIKRTKIILVNNFREYLREKGNGEREEIDENDIATVCYTSGSTGLPKGVILTHKNILSNVYSQPFEITDRDIFLSYLPISHMFERTCGYYAAILNGATIAICENHENLLDYAQKYKPTLMLVIPRVIEKINKRLDEGGTARILSKIPILKKIVGKKLMKKIGGRVRFLVSGAAPLGKELTEKFWGLGVKIYEGYGMTECAPIITANNEKEYRFGSVGKPIKDVKIKVEDGRLYVKSPGLMKGYTQKALTREKVKKGWFDTGDLAHIDQDGFLYIDGRSDTWIVMSTGKKTFPEPIEKKLVTIRRVDQVFVFGIKKPYLIALIYGDMDSEKLQVEIDKINQKLSKYEAVKKFLIIKKPFTVENGLLTHTLKLQRLKIYDKYKKEIEGLYIE